MQHKIGFYLRVSTDEQAAKSEGSLDNQLYRLQSFVDIKNMQFSDWGEVVEVYKDEGFSAKDTRRPAFQKMMSDVKSSKINLILVIELSRLSRNILDFCLLLEELRKVDAKFLSLKEQFDTTTAAGEMMVFNMVNLAQFERKQTSERVSMNFHARALRGLRNGGPVPLGYDKDPKDASRLVVNQEEADIVRTIFRIFLEEGSLSPTVNRLHTEGIMPKPQKRKDFVHNQKRLWTTDSLKLVLKSYTYIGKKEVNKSNKKKDPKTLKHYERYEIVKASWPALIEEDLFALVQRTILENKEIACFKNTKGKVRVYVLGSVLRCSECRGALVGSSCHGQGGVYRYYTHRSKQGRKLSCSINNLKAQDLETQVLNHLDNVLKQEGYLDNLERRMSDQENGQHLSLKKEKRTKLIDLESVNQEIDSCFHLQASLKKEEGLDNLTKNQLRNLDTRKIKIENRLKEIDLELESRLTPVSIRSAIESNLVALHKRKAVTRLNLKRLIRRVVKDIVVSPKGLEINYWATPTEGNFRGEGSKILPFSSNRNKQHLGNSKSLENGDFSRKSKDWDLPIESSSLHAFGGSPETRTRTGLPPLDFESSASTSSTREPHILNP